MRVLYIIDSLVPGGAELSLAALAPHLVAAGVDLHVAALHDRPGLQPELGRAGAVVHVLAGVGGRPGRVRRSAALIRRIRPDVVHTTLFEADVAGRVAARLTGTPVVTSLVNMTYGPEHRADPAVRTSRLVAAQAIDAASARLAVRFHAVGSAVADVMSQRLRIPRWRIEVIPRGRDRAVLGERTAPRRAGARARLGVSDGDALVLTVARQEHQKGLDVLLDAVTLLGPGGLRGGGNVRFVVAGRPGDATGRLVRQVARLGLDGTVTFLGPRGDVPDLLCAADAFVLPTRREGSPGAVLEAMALEAPIVVSDLPEVREVVDATMAHLAPVGSAPALADAIGAVLADPVGSRARAVLARHRFDATYDIERVADRTIAFYRSALGCRRVTR